MNKNKMLMHGYLITKEASILLWEWSSELFLLILCLAMLFLIQANARAWFDETSLLSNGVDTIKTIQHDTHVDFGI